MGDNTLSIDVVVLVFIHHYPKLIKKTAPTGIPDSISTFLSPCYSPAPGLTSSGACGLAGLSKVIAKLRAIPSEKGLSYLSPLACRSYISVSGSLFCNLHIQP